MCLRLSEICSFDILCQAAGVLLVLVMWRTQPVNMPPIRMSVILTSCQSDILMGSMLTNCALQVTNTRCISEQRCVLGPDLPSLPSYLAGHWPACTLPRRLTARRCSSGKADRDRRVQAQRAAERGADADVTSAKRQLAAAQQELQAALQEQDALASVSNQVRMCPSPSRLTTILSSSVQYTVCSFESARSQSRRPRSSRSTGSSAECAGSAAKAGCHAPMGIWLMHRGFARSIRSTNSCCME